MSGRHVSRRKTLKRVAAKRDGRPMSDYVWRDGVLRYADGVPKGGIAVYGIPKVPKPKAQAQQPVEEARAAPPRRYTPPRRHTPAPDYYDGIWEL